MSNTQPKDDFKVNFIHSRKIDYEPVHIDDSLAKGLRKRFLREFNEDFTKRFEINMRRVDKIYKQSLKKIFNSHLENITSLFDDLLISLAGDGVKKKRRLYAIVIGCEEDNIVTKTFRITSSTYRVSTVRTRFTNHVIERLFQRLKTNNYHVLIEELKDVMISISNIHHQSLHHPEMWESKYEILTTAGMYVVALNQGEGVDVLTFVDSDKLRGEQKTEGDSMINLYQSIRKIDD